MTTVKIDVNLPHSPEGLQAGPLGIAMHVAGLTYSRRFQTDGYIAAASLGYLLQFDHLSIETGGIPGVASFGEEVSPELVVEMLVGSGLWLDVDGGYQIRDYLRDHPSKAQLAAQREKRVEAGRKGGSARRKDPE